MNINEVEIILETLCARHANLDEAMLVTLLTAGGWEEKNIRDAVVLFRTTHGGKRNNAVQALFIPPTENPILPQAADISHTLMERVPSSEGKESTITESHREAISENSSPLGASLSAGVMEKTEEPIKESEVAPSKPQPRTPAVDIQEDTIPENLPLRPFESNSHVWPFSLYKDVFHSAAAPLSAPVVDEKKKDEHLSDESFEVHPPLGKEDKLTLLAEIMLGVILLILAYMYSNGRL